MPLNVRFIIAACLLITVLPATAPRANEAQHGISIFGDLKYGTDFEHFDYVNPDAPQGGTLRQSATGSFDSFNPYIIKGDAAAGLGFVYETLMTASLDEPFSEYGLIAETVEVPDDRSHVRFNLNPEARWHDGVSITPEDVVFSFEMLTTKGHPLYRYYYENVDKVEKTGERQVTFTFDQSGINRELPLIVGQLPILPEHHFENHSFETADLTIPLGSGPYRLVDFQPGRSVTYERFDDYWGRDLPVNVGRNNYQRVVFEYFRDADVALEAFKAGDYDLRLENSAKRWVVGYESPALSSGAIVKEKLEISPPARMQGYVFNTRREIFKDPRVRYAIAHAFDFEWSNRTLMYDQYERIDSYFHGDPELSASGLPSEAELELLERHRENLPPEVFTTEYEPPSTDGSGSIRGNLREALRLLRDAGWEVRNGVLTHTDTGREMRFELLFGDPSSERLAVPFARNLERLGIQATVRVVDPAQYENRMESFDFDMTTDIWAQSESPGNEQREYWGSEAANTRGSRNTIGIQDRVVDALIDEIIRAPDREALETACKALDRVLLWGHYVVPHFVDDGLRIAYWDKFGIPEVLPDSLDLMAWWIDPDKAERIRTKTRQAATE